MSSDRQIYSIAYQEEAIARYAASNGFIVARSFSDEGRSGLTLEGRPALQQLLSEVVSGCAAFQAILVYDVSRWGRFQDIDESAHYEFLCRRAGIAVHYCAEIFRNDASFEAAFMKNLKRAMAGEFSRELSVKISRSQRRVAGLGFRAAGPAPYGMVRMMLDPLGSPVKVMEKGEEKLTTAHRVTLVPGPEDEVAVVRRIFTMSADEGLCDRQIADVLNRDHVKPRRASQWSRESIATIIRNEAYMGTLIFNKRRTRLRALPVTNDPSEWLRIENAFSAIIDPRLFRRAHRARHRRSEPMSRRHLLSRLRRLLSEEGYLSSRLIRETPSAPCVGTYVEHFGSLAAAYEAIGYKPLRADHPFVSRPRRRTAKIFREEVIAALVSAGADISRALAGSLIQIDSKLQILILMAKPVKECASPAWSIAFAHPHQAHLLLVGLMPASGCSVERLVLVPPDLIPKSAHLQIGSRMLARMAPNIVDDLGQLYAKIHELGADSSLSTPAYRQRPRRDTLPPPCGWSG